MSFFVCKPITYTLAMSLLEIAYRIYLKFIFEYQSVVCHLNDVLHKICATTEADKVIGWCKIKKIVVTISRHAL